VKFKITAFFSRYFIYANGFVCKNMICENIAKGVIKRSFVLR